MSVQDAKPKTNISVKHRNRCKLCPRKHDRKVTLTCLKCKECFCKNHLFFLCVHCINMPSKISASEEMNMRYVKAFKHRIQNLYKQNYCIFCNSSKIIYRKTSKLCDSCGLNICKFHTYKRCQKCETFIFPVSCNEIF